MKIYLKDKIWLVQILCVAVGFLLLAVALYFYVELSQGVMFAAVSASIPTIVINSFPPRRHPRRMPLKDFQIFFSMPADFFMSKFQVAESASGMSCLPFCEFFNQNRMKIWRPQLN